MADIVERLRARQEQERNARQLYVYPDEHIGEDEVLFGQAADTIDRQREEIGRLHEALSAVLADMPIIDCDRLHHAKEDRHGAGLCPVETRLEAAIDRASSVLSDTTREK